MRPVRKGLPYLFVDGQDYEKARDGLIARLGRYCSYCECELKTGWEVEHIQPKSVTANQHLEKQWTNFLLSCKNCNSRKGVKNLPLSDWLLPDRDNTFIAFQYLDDGRVIPVPGAVALLAARTIETVNLNLELAAQHDEKDVLLALDRRTQRMNILIQAKRWRGKWDLRSNQDNEDAICELATATGFFSIWMTVFEGVSTIRNRLIATFAGTEQTCFDPLTTVAQSPHPNTDNLLHGGKI